MGPTYSISIACITSNFSILNAANHIIDGDAEVVNSYPVTGASISLSIENPAGHDAFWWL